MIFVKDVLSAMEVIAPYSYAEKWDNCGLLVGRLEAEVNKVLVSLDITSRVVSEAKSLGCQVIVAHHPIFFDIKAINNQTPQGEILLSLIEGKIAAICMHTNLDFANGGVNDVLAKSLGLKKSSVPIGETAQGRVTELAGKPVSAVDFAKKAKDRLMAQSVRVYDSGRPVFRVALNSGAGASVFRDAVLMGCDTFISGDIKYSVFLEAAEYNVNLIDMGHFTTENVICVEIAEYLAKSLNEGRTTGVDGRLKGPDKNMNVQIFLSMVSKEPFICL